MFERFGQFLDKIKFNDETLDKQKSSNQIALDNHDGAIQIDSDSMSQYAMNLDWSYNSQSELIETYREVANYSLVDFAVEDIIGEMVSFNEDQDPVDLDLSNVPDEELSESIKDKVYESWNKVQQILDLKQTINRRAKQFYVDGRLSYQKVIDQKKPADGLLDVIELDARFITKYRGVKYDEQNQVITGVDEYFIYDENSGRRKETKETQRNQQFKTALKLNPKSITYVTSGLTDPKTGYAIGWLHKAVKPANQLRMMENSLVIYRITRAPERRVFYVDTANLPKSKAEQYLRSLKNNYHNKMSFDPESGSFSDSRHLQTMQENFWLPRNSSGKGTEVSTLPGGCFAMDTEVSLLDGRELSIRDIESEMNEGKTLWTYSCDPITGKVAPGLISWAGVTQKSAKVMKITLDNGETIICTPDHQYPVYGKGFVRAEDLEVDESMIPLYRQNKNISEHKKLDYEEFYDNETKQWIYTHRMVADELVDDVVEYNVYDPEVSDGSYDVRHHIDHNRYNNDPSNLCFMSWSDHQLYHRDHRPDEQTQKMGTMAAKSRIEYMKLHDPDAYAEMCAGVAKRSTKMWESLSSAERQERCNSIKQGINDYINSMTPEERDARAANSRKNLRKGAERSHWLRANDAEFRAMVNEKVMEYWTPSKRAARGAVTKANSLSRWNERGDELRANHKAKQKVEFSHDMLRFVIDCVKGKTTHQVTIRDVTDMLNANQDLVDQLLKINEEKSVPNWDRSKGFSSRLVRSLVMQFGYSTWSDFRKNESKHNHRIAKIEYLDDEIEVGTLTIDSEEKHHDFHTFALSCGIFTKNSNLDQIADVEYFQKQLYKALNIPTSRLESDSMMPLGRSTEISRDELKFSKFVSKVRKRFNMMFLDLLKTELILTKVITPKEWDDLEQKIEFRYALDMYIEETKQSEMLRDRLELVRDIEPYIGKYVSNEYVRSTILKQTEQDIEQQDKLIDEESKDERFVPSEDPNPTPFR